LAGRVGSRGVSFAVIAANLGGSLYYALQGRFGLAVLLGFVAGGVAWLGLRQRSSSTTFRPVRTLTAAAIFFGLVTGFMALGVTGADEGDPRTLGRVGVAVGAVFTGLMLWALVRARGMGFGWSSELERRQRPDDNPRG